MKIRQQLVSEWLVGWLAGWLFSAPTGSARRRPNLKPTLHVPPPGAGGAARLWQKSCSLSWIATRMLAGLQSKVILVIALAYEPPPGRGG